MHHVAQHHPTGSKTPQPYAARSSGFGSESSSVEDDVDVWHYTNLQLHARNDDDESKKCTFCQKIAPKCKIRLILPPVLRPSQALDADFKSYFNSYIATGGRTCHTNCMVSLQVHNRQL